MTCERCQALLIDRLTPGGDLGVELDMALQHARDCDVCRAWNERLGQVWSGLSHWGVPPAQDDVAGMARLRAAVHADRLRGATTSRRAAAWLGAGLAAGLLIGVLGSSMVRGGRVLGGPTESEFLLLFHRDGLAADPAPGPALTRMIDEYTIWREDLEDRGVLLASRLLDAGSRSELRGAGPALSISHSAPRTDADGYVSGFFLVRAANLTAAEAMARTSPHLGYGGSIEVRPVAIPPTSMPEGDR
jgi:hypothetical protein